MGTCTEIRDRQVMGTFDPHALTIALSPKYSANPSPHAQTSFGRVWGSSSTTTTTTPCHSALRRRPAPSSPPLPPPRQCTQATCWSGTHPRPADCCVATSRRFQSERGRPYLRPPGFSPCGESSHPSSSPHRHRCPALTEHAKVRTIAMITPPLTTVSLLYLCKFHENREIDPLLWQLTGLCLREGTLPQKRRVAHPYHEPGTACDPMFFGIGGNLCPNFVFTFHLSLINAEELRC